MKTLKTLALLAIGLVLIVSCTSKKEKMNSELKSFIKKHDSLIIPLYKEVALAGWNAAISGKAEDYKKSEDVQLQILKITSNKESLAKLKEIKISGLISDSILSRELDVLYRTYLMAEADTAKLNAAVRMQTQIEMKYSNFRTEVKGKKLSDNDIEDILKHSKNTEEQKAAWMAQKKIGPVVAEDLKKLVKLRNEIAKDLGFKNYHQMSLTLSDQDPKEVSSLFEELDTLTKGAYAEVKGDIDNYLVKYYGMKSKDELMPWNYQNRFFQEAPKIYDVDLDKYYKDKNLEVLTATYYAGIGLPIDEMLKKSDLYEKPGKNQHAFCSDMDKEGDVRVLCNIKPNSYWMGTMLHEFGHAVYDRYKEMSVPWDLRDPAHTFTTEAIAELFGRFASNPQWLKDNAGISEEEKMKIADNALKSLRLQQLVFSRWAQLMYNFEKEMYSNPDQDLNKLWWDLAGKYQMLKRPEGRNEPDWATKIHIATYPCYYHNYLMGEILASQLYYYIVTNVIKSGDFRFQSFSNNKGVGEYLKAKIFMPANRYYWNDMIEKATGEKLTAKYYAKQFVK
ncbi:MAG: M2 family metallopeptidase [Bacteroidales bacterium]